MDPKLGRWVGPRNKKSCRPLGRPLFSSPILQKQEGITPCPLLVLIMLTANFISSARRVTKSVRCRQVIFVHDVFFSPSLLSLSNLFIFPIARNHSKFFSVLFYFFILEREMKKNCNDFSCHLLCINPISYLGKRRYTIRTLAVLENRYHKKISNKWFYSLIHFKVWNTTCIFLQLFPDIICVTIAWNGVIHQCKIALLK